MIQSTFKAARGLLIASMLLTILVAPSTRALEAVKTPTGCEPAGQPTIPAPTPVGAPPVPSCVEPPKESIVTELHSDSNRIIEALGALKSSPWGSIFAAFVAAIVAILGNHSLQRKRLKQESVLANQKASLESAQAFVTWRVKQMEELYGPLRALLAQSKGVYTQLCEHLCRTFPDKYQLRDEAGLAIPRKAYHVNTGKDWVVFKLLEHMPQLAGDEINAGPLIDQVIAIGKRIVGVVSSRAGLVLPIQDLLTAAFGEYLAHFVVLKEVHTAMKEGKPPRQYKTGFYPRSLNSLVDAGFDLIAHEIAEWEARLQRFSSGSFEKPVAGRPGRELTPEQKTIAYYDQNADRYVAKTIHANMEPVYEKFLARVKAKGRILDVGSGAGRDLRAFRAKGFEPLGIELSNELALRARANSGETCLVTSIDAFNDKFKFDGIWACASLLHISRDEIQRTLDKLASLLKPHGVLYFSVQKGSGEKKLADGRLFTYYNKDEIAEKLNFGKLFSSVEVWESPDDSLHRAGVEWINVLAQLAAPSPDTSLGSRQ